MDNTFFVSLTDSVSGIVEAACVAVIVLLGLCLGATVGYSMYLKILSPHSRARDTD